MESDVLHSDDHSVTSDEESVAGEPLDRVPDEEVPIVLPHPRYRHSCGHPFIGGGEHQSVV